MLLLTIEKSAGVCNSIIHGLPLIAIFRAYLRDWASFSQTNMENKFINILALIIACNSEDWPEWLPPQLQYDMIIVQCSYFLVPSPCLLEWLDCLKGEIPGYSCLLPPWSQQCCMLFLNIRPPVFTSSILFRLFGPHTNQSHNARFKCWPLNYRSLLNWIFRFLISGTKMETLSNLSVFGL